MHVRRTSRQESSESYSTRYGAIPKASLSYMLGWKPHAISHIGRRVSDEMDYMKNVLQAKVSCLTQDSREW